MRKLLFQALAGGLAAGFLAGGQTSAQSVEEAVFRVPVEVEDIRYLTSVRVECVIQDGTRDGPLDAPNWSTSHTIRNLVSWRLWSPDYPRCDADPLSEEAAARCAAEAPGGGLSWSGMIEIPVRDYQGGGISVSDGRAFKCATNVGYDTEPEAAGEASLEDGLCAGFFENPYSVTARERYQTYTGGDIADARLCVRGEFAPAGGVMEVPEQYIHGGEGPAEEPAEEPADEEASEPATIANPDLAARLPSRAASAIDAGVASRLSSARLAQTDGACADAVQGEVAWNYDGDTRWGEANVRELCAGAENSTAPAACFERVMHGGVDWGGGTRWQWRNALNLCKGSRDADETVSCFEDAVSEGVSWRNAIARCQA